MVDNTKVVYCDCSFSGTTIRPSNGKKAPAIGVVGPESGLHLIYPFRGTERAREFCKDLLDICDRLDKEEAENDGR